MRKTDETPSYARVKETKVVYMTKRRKSEAPYARDRIVKAARAYVVAARAAENRHEDLIRAIGVERGSSHRLTLTELAQDMGVSVSFVSDVLAGKCSRFSPKLAAKLLPEGSIFAR